MPKVNEVCLTCAHYQQFVGRCNQQCNMTTAKVNCPGWKQKLLFAFTDEYVCKGCGEVSSSPICKVVLAEEYQMGTTLVPQCTACKRFADEVEGI